MSSVLYGRPELRVLITSATLDSVKFSEYFDKCPVRYPGYANKRGMEVSLIGGDQRRGILFPCEDCAFQREPFAALRSGSH